MKQIKQNSFFKVRVRNFKGTVMQIEKVQMHDRLRF